MQYARILIVEDDPIASEVLAGWARHHGSSITSVASTAEADSAFAGGEYDLILSDVHLPGNHRLEWVERILASDFPPPLVLLTGNPELETTLRAANLPVAGYLVKPPDFTALTTLAQRLVGDFRRRRTLRELSRDVAVLLTRSGGETDAVREQLLHLSHSLAAEAGANPRAVAVAAAEPPWRTAIADTIATLERTKHSFRSKELGELRQRLRRLVPDAPAAGVAGTAAA